MRPIQEEGEIPEFEPGSIGDRAMNCLLPPMWEGIETLANKLGLIEIKPVFTYSGQKVVKDSDPSLTLFNSEDEDHTLIVCSPGSISDLPINLCCLFLARPTSKPGTVHLVLCCNTTTATASCFPCAACSCMVKTIPSSVVGERMILFRLGLIIASSRDNVLPH